MTLRGTAGPQRSTSATLVVNGVAHTVPTHEAQTLLAFLRDVLQLTGAKAGCERGECGACAVLIDGRARPSCLIPAATVDGEVTTIEGLADAISDLREAFADLGAFQCGYCTPGQLVAAEAWLRSGRAGGDEETRLAMQGNVCRCTGYAQIVAAIARVARQRGTVNRP